MWTRPPMLARASAAAAGSAGACAAISKRLSENATGVAGDTDPWLPNTAADGRENSQGHVRYNSGATQPSGWLSHLLLDRVAAQQAADVCCEHKRQHSDGENSSCIDHAAVIRRSKPTLNVPRHSATFKIRRRCLMLGVNRGCCCAMATLRLLWPLKLVLDSRGTLGQHVPVFAARCTASVSTLIQILPAYKLLDLDGMSALALRCEIAVVSEIHCMHHMIWS